VRRLALLALLATGVAALAACGGGEADQASSLPEAGQAATTAPEQSLAKVDPREDGFQVALGEWALTPEAKAIRPGRVVFVVTNRGTMPHGFEIEREGDDDEGEDEKAETRFLEPGESTKLELELREGVYKLECNVEGHDDMGMEMLLEVSDRAALTKAPARAPRGATVEIEAFAFAPATIEARVGQEVRWANHDPADHTVTQEGDGFDSGTLAQGATFKATFDNPGEYRYICELHPGMKGKVVVKG
jgi:plastocyanin